jgi:hypothetical protein
MCSTLRGTSTFFPIEEFDFLLRSDRWSFSTKRSLLGTLHYYTRPIPEFHPQQRQLIFWKASGFLVPLQNVNFKHLNTKNKYFLYVSIYKLPWYSPGTVISQAASLPMTL